MKSYKTVEVIKEELDNITCNMCCKKVEKNQAGYFDDYISIEKTWGYFSPFDGETHSFELCSDCYGKLLSQLKLEPRQINY